MASASLGNGGASSSRSVNGFRGSSSSVDWLGKEMLELRLRDKSDQDDDRVSFLVFHMNYQKKTNKNLITGLMIFSYVLVA